jgi:hypothetical protein
VIYYSLYKPAGPTGFNFNQSETKENIDLRHVPQIRGSLPFRVMSPAKEAKYGERLGVSEHLIFVVY